MEPLELEIEVFNGVYPPCEDTHHLLDSMQVRGSETVLEVGCGAGLISLNCAARGCRVTAVDRDPKAVECTLHNAKANGLQISVRQGDLFYGIASRYDVIVFNPPYLPPIEGSEGGEMAGTWDGGKGGVELLLHFLEQAGQHLKGVGRLYTLYSSQGDVGAVEKAMASRFERTSIATKNLFFETLYAVELEVRRNGPR